MKYDDQVRMIERFFECLKCDKRFHLYPRYTIYFHDRRNDLKSITFNISGNATSESEIEFCIAHLWEHEITFPEEINFSDLYKSLIHKEPKLAAKLIGEVSLEGTEEEVWERLQDIFWSGSI